MNLDCIWLSRERRRLKKLRKDRLRQLTVTDAATKRHKHKHKCGEELCKHRKHKKRRKHRKHHHRPESSPTDAQSEEQQAKLTGTESDAPMDDEPDSVDSMETTTHTSSAKESLRALAARNITARSVNIRLNKVQWPIDEDIASSITEDSSGSSYVSLRILSSTSIIIF